MSHLHVCAAIAQELNALGAGTDEFGVLLQKLQVSDKVIWPAKTL